MYLIQEDFFSRRKDSPFLFLLFTENFAHKEIKKNIQQKNCHFLFNSEDVVDDNLVNTVTYASNKITLYLPQEHKQR